VRICIVGSGVVGHTTGVGLSQQGHEVVHYDTSASRREVLAAEGWRTVVRLADIAAPDVYMICVPTPSSEDGFDLSYVRAAASEVAQALGGERYATVVVRSTLLPGTMRAVVLPLLEGGSNLKLGQDFGLCYNPEFLRAATALDDLLHPPLTVVGEFDRKSADMVARLHEPFGALVLRTTPENAEAIKCFSNAYNAMKVSFFNLLFLAGQRAGLEPEVVANGLATAATGIRFADYGAPGGRPYGGACLPKDLAACITFLEQRDLNPSLLSAVSEINRVMAEQAGVTPRGAS
jgi:UDPglucose 6-dehydrogenase